MYNATDQQEIRVPLVSPTPRAPPKSRRDGRTPSKHAETHCLSLFSAGARIYSSCIKWLWLLPSHHPPGKPPLQMWLGLKLPCCTCRPQNAQDKGSHKQPSAKKETPRLRGSRFVSRPKELGFFSWSQSFYGNAWETGQQTNLRIFPYSIKHQLRNFGHVSHLPPNHYLLFPNMELGQSIRYVPEETALGRWRMWWPSPLSLGAAWPGTGPARDSLKN